MFHILWSVSPFCTHKFIVCHSKMYWNRSILSPITHFPFKIHTKTSFCVSFCITFIQNTLKNWFWASFCMTFTQNTLKNWFLSVILYYFHSKYTQKYLLCVILCDFHCKYTQKHQFLRFLCEKCSKNPIQLIEEHFSAFVPRKTSMWAMILSVRENSCKNFHFPCQLYIAKLHV